MPCRVLVVLAVSGLLLAQAGCGNNQPPAPRPAYSYSYGEGGRVNPEQVQFVDDASSNVRVEDGRLDLTFTDSRGGTVRVADYRGKKNVVLVFMRGSTAGICPYCGTQMSRLIKQHAELVRRDAALLVVYPGPREGVRLFQERAQAAMAQGKLPFPLFLDTDSKAAKALGIEADRARPATYILDREGKVRFAYVGATVSDRPSIKSILRQLDALGPQTEIPAP